MSQKPVIEAVNGWAVGGGHIMHVLCDLTIAAETAKFAQVGPKVGSFEAGFGAAYLARVIGEKKAREMWFLCRTYTAQEALEMGLVNKVVPSAQLLPTAKEWAEKICENSSHGIRRAKEAMIRGKNMALEDGLRLELSFFEEMLQSEDYKEGLRALSEGRKPEYKGR